MISFLISWIVAAFLGVFVAGRLVSAPAAASFPRYLRRFWHDFTAHVRARHSDVEVLGALPAEFGVIVALSGRVVALPLGELHARTQEFPGRFEQTLDLFLAAAKARVAQHGMPGFDQVFCDIRPLLRSEHWVRQNSPAAGDFQFAAKLLDGERCRCFVLADRGAFVLVTAAHLRHWRKTVDEIDRVAMQNRTHAAVESRCSALTNPRRLHLVRAGS